MRRGRASADQTALGRGHCCRLLGPRSTEPGDGRADRLPQCDGGRSSEHSLPALLAQTRPPSARSSPAGGRGCARLTGVASSRAQGLRRPQGIPRERSLPGSKSGAGYTSSHPGDRGSAGARRLRTGSGSGCAFRTRPAEPRPRRGGRTAQHLRGAGGRRSCSSRAPPEEGPEERAEGQRSAPPTKAGRRRRMGRRKRVSSPRPRLRNRRRRTRR